MFFPLCPSSSVPSAPRHLQGKRKGAIIALTAVLVITLMAMLAFSIDTGYMLSAQTDLQRSVDAGALAGAGAIADGTGAADSTVRDFIMANPIVGRPIRDHEIEVETGHWDDNTNTFTPSRVLPSAIRARVTARELPHFFGRAFFHDHFDVTCEAIAVHMPRDIVVTLDYSGSMNNDSELRSVDRIGRDELVANLRQIWNELGTPQYGNMQFDPVYISSNSTSTVKDVLGLDDVAYPYPSGSWSDYISYVKTSSRVQDAGYQKKYGYLTWIAFLLEKKPKSHQTPPLWSVSQQPITAVKDAVTVFLSYLQEVDSDDRVGLSVYTYTNDGAYLESGLTENLQVIEDISRHRQAAHYQNGTNIGAGLQVARIELEENARQGAFKMIVLMTDGKANLPGNSTRADEFLIDEAHQCAESHFPVVTISLGSSADTALMQQVADMTGGTHFNIPGGNDVADYEDRLKDVFRDIAGHRPLKLVK